MTSDAGGTRPDFASPALMLPTTVERNRSRVKLGFWTKLRRAIGKVPFAEDVVAMYYCALDPATPLKVRATLLAALVYFIVPADIVPDFIAALGYTDDASVIAAALALVAGHIRPEHRDRARGALDTGAPAGRA